MTQVLEVPGDPSFLAPAVRPGPDDQHGPVGGDAERAERGGHLIGGTEQAGALSAHHADPPVHRDRARDVTPEERGGGARVEHDGAVPHQRLGRRAVHELDGQRGRGGEGDHHSTVTPCQNATWFLMRSAAARRSG
jgi:hypothetical protein